MSLTIDLSPYLDEGPVRLRLPKMTPDEFWNLCQRYPDMNAERNADGEIIIMSPTETVSGGRSGEAFRQLANWAVEHDDPDTVTTYFSSSGFILPNGATRSPDAAYVSAARWNSLQPHQRTRYAQVVPDFVIEVRSPSDRLRDAKAKMEEYRANGVRLGFLIDRAARRVYIYRPNHPVEEIRNPTEISGNPELPGFVMKMKRIFGTPSGITP